MMRQAHGAHEAAADGSAVAKRRRAALIWFYAALFLLIGVVAVALVAAIAPVPGRHVDGTSCGGLVAEYLTRGSVAAGTCTDGASLRARPTAFILGGMVLLALACGAVGRRGLGRNA